MGLFLILVVLSVIHHGLTQDLSFLPQLQDNKLYESSDTLRLGALGVECSPEQVEAGSLSSQTLQEALTTDNFKNRPFTSSLILSHKGLQISGNEARFKMVEIKTRKYLYALEVDPSGEKAYWLQQSNFKEEPYPYLDIPEHPTADQPQYVFTADFAGSSWTVTPLGNGFLRLRHVMDLFQRSQFNDLPPDQKGGPVSFALQYRDYGYTVEKEDLVETVHSFAYMHYSGGRWTLHFQRKVCYPRIVDRAFSNNTRMLSSVNLRTHDFYHISTKDYLIPMVSFLDKFAIVY